MPSDSPAGDPSSGTTTNLSPNAPPIDQPEPPTFQPQNMDMPAWLLFALEGVNKLPTIVEGVTHLFQIIHNEMVAGGGLSNPANVTKVLMDNAVEVAKALENVATVPGGSGDSGSGSSSRSTKSKS